MKRSVLRNLQAVAWQLAVFAGLTLSAHASNRAASPLPAPEAASFAPVGAVSRPMQGWVTFCKAQPAECAEGPLTPATVHLSAQSWSELTRVNGLANRVIEPMTDDEHYGIYRMGIRNWWTYPDDGKGNCNDYVLLKRRLLVEAGWPPSALLMTVVITPAGEGHLVLMVRTDRGDLILDSARDTVLAWDETGYTFVKRQAETDRNVWVSIQSVTSSPLTAALRGVTGVISNR